MHLLTMICLSTRKKRIRSKHHHHQHLSLGAVMSDAKVPLTWTNCMYAGPLGVWRIVGGITKRHFGQQEDERSCRTAPALAFGLLGIRCDELLLMSCLKADPPSPLCEDRTYSSISRERSVKLLYLVRFYRAREDNCGTAFRPRTQDYVTL